MNGHPHPDAQEATDRAIDRQQDDAWWAGYATPAEMDGAAEDWWARLGGER